MRLQQYLARAGIASRRKSEDFIREGRVSINGQVAQIGAVVNEGDSVRLDGERVRLPEKRVVIALNKPLGVVTTKSDPHATQTVYQLVPDIPGLHQVGRLDKDSEGLLLLTNDGNLTERLTHPRYGVQKIYRVWCKKGEVSFTACRRLVEGVPLDDYVAKAIEAKPMNGGARVVMSEGKKREVKRMLSAVSYPVERLLRTQVGPIELGSLQPGQWRYLSAEEIAGLEQFTNPEFAKATRQPKVSRPVRKAVVATPKAVVATPKAVVATPKVVGTKSRSMETRSNSKPNQQTNRAKPKSRPGTTPPEIPQELLPKPKRKPSPDLKRTKDSRPADKFGSSATSDKPKRRREDQPKPKFDPRKKPRGKHG